MVRITTHGRNVAFGVPHSQPSICLAAGLHHLSTGADKSDQNIKNLDFIYQTLPTNTEF